MATGCLPPTPSSAAPIILTVQQGSCSHSASKPSPGPKPLPRDKSLTHRAIIFAALAKGTSTIFEPLLGEDCLATANIMAALGVTVDIRSDRIVITSPHGAAGLRPQSAQALELSRGSLGRGSLGCGNSGTTARLLLGLLSGIDGFTGTLTGDASLSKRPMGRVTQLIDPEESGLFAPYDRLPITISGRAPKPRSYVFGKASGQVKSALLLHSLSCIGEVEIRLPAGGRDHTEQFLLGQGADITMHRGEGCCPCHQAPEGGGDEEWEKIIFRGPFEPKAGEWRIPADPSSLAFLWVAVLTAGQKPRCYDEVLANPTRTGGLKVLQRMAAGFDVTSEAVEKPKDAAKGGTLVEPTVRVSCPAKAHLQPTDITPAEVPSLIDEIPILAVAACFADGRSRFSGLGELRVKESDRLKETSELLRSAGANVAIEGDDLVIEGSPAFVPQPFDYNSHGDHRMVMAAIVLARSAAQPCRIGDYRAVGTSFPAFLESLDYALSDVT